MEDKKVQAIKNMTEEQLKEKQKELELKVLNELHKIEEKTIEFNEELAQKNIKELKAIGYNFNTEDGE